LINNANNNAEENEPKPTGKTKFLWCTIDHGEAYEVLSSALALYIRADLIISPLGFVFRMSNKHKKFYTLMQAMNWLSLINLIAAIIQLRKAYSNYSKIVKGRSKMDRAWQFL